MAEEHPRRSRLSVYDPDDLRATREETGARYPRAFRGNRITPMEGSSLAPVLAGGRASSRAVYFEHEGNRAVRLGRWKLVSRAEDDAFAWWQHDDPGPGNWELFDLEADRTETTNLAEERPDLVQSLAELWHQWALRTDVLPYPEKTWP